jgi:hypothetical protein
VFLTFKKGKGLVDKMQYIADHDEPYAQFQAEDNVTHRVNTYRYVNIKWCIVVVDK